MYSYVGAAAPLSYTREVNMQANITDRLIVQLEIRARQKQKAIYCWDLALRGFGVRIAPTGSVTYQIQKDGSRKAFQAQNSVEARNLALQALLPLVATPIARDPRIGLYGQIYPRSVEVLDLPALTGLWRRYLVSRGGKTRYWSDLDLRFRTHVLPKLELSKQGIRDVLATKDGYPVAQRTLWEGLSPFMKWLVSEDMIPSNPMDGIIPPRVPKSRDRVLSDREIRDFWRASEAMGPLWGPFLRLLLLTAQRRSEVAGMTWNEIDMPLSLWHIPPHRSKNGKGHIVHISPQAMDILKTNPIFIGRKVAGFSKAKAKLDAISGIQGIRLHDLRRTAATGMQSLGIPPHVIERVLNHYQGSPYQRFEYLEERKAALEAWGRHVATIGNT